MEAGNLAYYNKFRQPPAWALREIRDGNLKGKTDINPQWRFEAMTEVFGPVGIGWKYDKPVFTIFDGANDEKICLCETAVYVREEGEWSEAIYGIGGSVMVNNFSKAGLKNNDECFKMALTDAFSYAFKQLGCAADIYAGKWDGSKYKDMESEPERNSSEKPNSSPKPERKAQAALAGGEATKEQTAQIKEIAYSKNDKDERIFTDDEITEHKKSRKTQTAEEVINAMVQERAKRCPEKYGAELKFEDDKIPF